MFCPAGTDGDRTLLRPIFTTRQITRSVRTSFGRLQSPRALGRTRRRRYSTSSCATAESRDNFAHLFYRTCLSYGQHCNDPQFWIIDHRERHMFEDHAPHQRMIVLRAALAQRQDVMAWPPLCEFRTDGVEPVHKLNEMRIAGIAAVIATEPG